MIFFSTIKQGLLHLFSREEFIVVGLVSFVVFALLYLFTLPGIYTGGRIGWVSLRFLTPRLIFFSVVMSILVSLIIASNWFLYKRNEQVKTCSSSATGGVLAGFLPPLLCCSSLLPIIFAGLAGIFPALSGGSGLVQGFISTYENYFFGGAILILAYAAYVSIREVSSCDIN